MVTADGLVTSNDTLPQVAGDERSLAHLGLRQIENVLPATGAAHCPEDRCTIATTIGIELVLPLRLQTPPGCLVHVALRSSNITVRRYLAGISIQNQIKGRICTLVPVAEGMLAQIDCGATLLASITRQAWER